MSLSLYLLRHGQAQGATHGGPDADHARKLSERGCQEIDRLAGCLQADAHFAPQCALVSSAVRTQQTAERLPLPRIELREDFYNADLAGLLAGLQGLDVNVSSALIVAHNPGISWLAASLLQPAACAGFAPGSMVALTLEQPWARLKPGSARLNWRLDPPDYCTQPR